MTPSINEACAPHLLVKDVRSPWFHTIDASRELPIFSSPTGKHVNVQQSHHLLWDPPVTQFSPCLWLDQFSGTHPKPRNPILSRSGPTENPVKDQAPFTTPNPVCSQFYRFCSIDFVLLISSDRRSFDRYSSNRCSPFLSQRLLGLWYHQTR